MGQGLPLHDTLLVISNRVLRGLLPATVLSLLTLVLCVHWIVTSRVITNTSQDNGSIIVRSTQVQLVQLVQ